MTEKKYKLTAPAGNIVIPKELMTEREVRDFVPQLIQDADNAAVWQAKAENDPIEDLLDWLKQSGYEVREL